MLKRSIAFQLLSSAAPSFSTQFLYAFFGVSAMLQLFIPAVWEGVGYENARVSAFCRRATGRRLKRGLGSIDLIFCIFTWSQPPYSILGFPVQRDRRSGKRVRLSVVRAFGWTCRSSVHHAPIFFFVLAEIPIALEQTCYFVLFILIARRICWGDCSISLLGCGICHGDIFHNSMTAWETYHGFKDLTRSYFTSVLSIPPQASIPLTTPFEVSTTTPWKEIERPLIRYHLQA